MFILYTYVQYIRDIPTVNNVKGNNCTLIHEFEWTWLLPCSTMPALKERLKITKEVKTCILRLAASFRRELMRKRPLFSYNNTISHKRGATNRREHSIQHPE